jgi:MYXO-CTERM domain-containing protein
MLVAARHLGRCAAAAAVVGAVLWAGELAAAPKLARPHGNVMGDGLDLLAPSPGPALPGKVCAAGDTVFGIDVSYYQGDIDWQAVAGDGVKFAWVRVSHSTQFKDPKFAANLAGARAAGIHTGVYQYFEPGQDPIAQAQLLLDLTGPLLPGDMPPMIDVESKDTVPKAQYADAIRAWLDHVEAATGVVPFIYTGYYYWNDNVGTAEFADYPLWIANYNPGCPLVPDAWATWTAHQTCDCGQIAGIDGAVDTDLFNGDEEALMGYAVGGAVCGDGKCSFGEDAYLCAADCPPCGVIPPEGATIDNGAACYELYGDPQYWRDEAVGHGGSLVWTHATELAEPSNYAVFRLDFAQAGEYALSVWIEPPFGETKQAKYVVHHADGETAVMVDQSAASGWVSLGSFNFAAATDHYVRIDDNTGELLDLEVSIVLDALQVLPVPVAGDTEAASSSGGGEATGIGSEGSGAGSSSGEVLVPTTGGASSSSGGSTGVGGAALPPGYGEQGCGCRGAPGGAGFGWLVLLGLVRRRRAQPRRPGIGVTPST